MIGHKNETSCVDENDTFQQRIASLKPSRQTISVEVIEHDSPLDLSEEDRKVLVALRTAYEQHRKKKQIKKRFEDTYQSVRIRD